MKKLAVSVLFLLAALVPFVQAETTKVVAVVSEVKTVNSEFQAEVQALGGELVLAKKAVGTPSLVMFFRDGKKLAEFPLGPDEKWEENRKLVLDWLTKNKPTSGTDPPKKYGRGYKRLSPEASKALHAEAFKKHGNRMKSLVEASTPPAEFDCKDMGWAGDPGDQADCGSCYLYSTVKTATSAFVKAGVGKVDVFRLSYQYGMDCHDFGGCDGGNGTEVIDWMVKNGWPAESYVDASGQAKSDYPPYSARVNQCRLAPGAKKWTPQSWMFVTSDQGDHPATVAEYKAAIMSYGRANVALDAGGQFMGYSGGVITRLGNSIDHEINVRGWSDAKQALLLENQWAGWGGAKTNGDSCAWLAYSAIGALQDPFIVISGVLPPPPPPPPPNGLPVITSPASMVGVVGVPATYQIVASNSPTTYAAAGLPAGWTCSASGTISGTATTTGTGSAMLMAFNSAGFGSLSSPWTVTTTPVPPPPPVPTPGGPITVVLTNDQVSSIIQQIGPVQALEEVLKSLKGNPMRVKP